MHNIYIGVGSNVDPESNLLTAFSHLTELFEAVSISTVYQSPAVGMIGNDFLNTVVSARTNLDTQKLKKALHGIEDRQGRDRTKGRFTDRAIDLDLLLYDDQIIVNESGLIPRPEIYTDAFVLQPLVDLDAELVDPISGRSMAALLLTLKQNFPERFEAMIAIPTLQFKANDRHRRQVSHR